jgi:hypothetical protein
MTKNIRRPVTPQITTIPKFFGEDLANGNDSLQQENKILRSKLGKRRVLEEITAPLHDKPCQSAADSCRRIC